MKRYFEFLDAKSSKFWEVWIEGSTVYTRFGKIGANGQTTIKEFPNVDAAQAALDKSTAEKLKKGYAESSQGSKLAQTVEPVQIELHLVAEELLTKCEQESTSAREIEEIVASHTRCYEIELCELCDYITGELGAHILEPLSSRSDLTESQQDRVLQAAMHWQGLGADIIHNLASHPSPSLYVKDTALEPDTFIGDVGDDYEEWVTSLFEIIQNNPGFADRGEAIAEMVSYHQDAFSISLPNGSKSEDAAAKTPCQACGGKNVLDAKFCTACGGQLSIVRYCSQCVSERQESARFCDHCGNEFD